MNDKPFMLSFNLLHWCGITVINEKKDSRHYTPDDLSYNSRRKQRSNFIENKKKMLQFNRSRKNL